jgi:hypothetical protein
VLVAADRCDSSAIQLEQMRGGCASRGDVVDGDVVGDVAEDLLPEENERQVAEQAAQLVWAQADRVQDQAVDQMGADAGEEVRLALRRARPSARSGLCTSGDRRL